MSDTSNVAEVRTRLFFTTYGLVARVEMTWADFQHAIWEAQWQVLTGKTWHESRPR